MMYREPSDSPWGLVVRCDTLFPGVYSVSTAGHGGIMVQIDATRQLLSPEAQAVGFQAGGYLNFEEDCDAPVVLRELMDSGIIAPRTDNYFRPGEYEACMEKQDMRVLTLDPYQHGVVINALNNLRNDLIEDKRPTDIVDEVLIKTVDAPSKSKRVKQKDER